MRQLYTILALLLVTLTGPTRACADDATNAADTVSLSLVEPDALHLYLEPNHTVTLRGNPLSLQEAADRITASTNLDAVALYIDPRHGQTNTLPAPWLKKISEAGVSVFLVEGAEPDTYDYKAEKSERRAVALNTDQLTTLLGRPNPSGKRLVPAVELSLIEHDEKTGLALQRMQLGLPGRSIWLVHEADELEHTSGIQLKKRW